MADSIFRLYAPDELGKDGYPPEWHATIKHAVREAAGHRCIRCGHPYSKGEGEWSACDDRCTHAGPYRVMDLKQRENPPYWFRIPSPTTIDLPVTNWLEPSGGDTAAKQAEYWAVEAQWRILTVHHLDGDKANCRWWNLVSLCQRCHLRVQRIVVMPRIWPWEHSDWFKPYVAGYYAHAYLGEDLTRAEVEERLDELLGLERVA